MKPNVYNVKRALEKIRFGIVKMINSPFLKNPVSFMIETITMTDDGHLWCTAPNLPEEKSLQGSHFPVNVTYVEKTEGLFIKVEGRAEIVNDNIPPCLVVNGNTVDGQRLIKVRIDEAQGFRKKVSSPNTSWLQSIKGFTI